MNLYDFVSLCITMYDNLWLYMTIRGYKDVPWRSKKWSPICGQSILFLTQESGVYRSLLWWSSQWLARNWPSFFTPPRRVLVTPYFESKNDGQSVANYVELHQSNVQDSWVENKFDWPHIGHYFLLQNKGLLGLALEE